jgi:hypothetical protein
MSIASDWGMWLAIVALLLAVGKFLDDYHVRQETKSKIRDILIRGFFVVQAVNVPDLGRGLAGRFWTLGSRLARRKFLAAFGIGFGLIFASLVVFVGPIVAGYLSLAPFAVFVAGTTVWLLLGLISSIKQDWLALLLALCSPIVIFVIICNITLFAAPILLWAVIPIFLFAIASSIPLFVISGVLLVLLCCRALIHILRFLALHILDAASDPQRSPFTYAFALVSILILTGKCLRTISSHII